MRFIAHVVCLKKDDKYIAETVFMKAAVLLQGGKADLASILEKAIASQMVAIKEKGQKLYTCAPIWAELYKQKRREQKQKDQKSTDTSTSGSVKRKHVQGSDKSKNNKKPKDDKLIQKKEEEEKKKADREARIREAIAAQKEKRRKENVKSLQTMSEAGKDKVIHIQAVGQTSCQMLLNWWDKGNQEGAVADKEMIVAPSEEESLDSLLLPTVPTLQLRNRAETKQEKMRLALVALNSLGKHLAELAEEGGSQNKVGEEEGLEKIRSLEAEVEQLRSNADIKDKRIKELEDQAEELDASLREKEQMLTEKEKQLKISEERLTDKEKQLEMSKERTKVCIDNFGHVVTTEIISRMKEAKEEGVYMNIESLEALLDDCDVVVRAYCKEVLDVKRSKKSEASDAEEEEDDDDEESDDNTDKDKSDDDDDDDDDDGGSGRDQSKDQSDSGDDTENEDERKPRTARPAGTSRRIRTHKKEGQTEREEEHSDQEQQPDKGQSTQNPENVPLEKLVKWWERKNIVLAYVSKLEKTCKDLKLKLQRKLSKQEQGWQEKIQEVQESFKGFLEEWPNMHFHSMEECIIPKHPACIQYLQSPPQIEPPEELKDMIPRTELQSLVLNVDVLLANSTEFECTLQFKELIMKEVDKARGVRRQLECMLEGIQPPEGGSSAEAIENGERCLRRMMKVLTAWTLLVKKEVEFLVSCLEKYPTQRLLYAIAPPPEALPVFYPVLWPETMEPYDGDRYAELVKQLQDWGDQMRLNEKMWRETLEANPEPEICRNVFEEGAKHTRQVLKFCNALIQHSIEVQRQPEAKQEVAALEIDVQWLAENLLKARIKVGRQAYGSWLATAFYCYKLAKARLRLKDSSMMEYTKDRQKKRQRLNLFDKIKPAEVCQSRKPTRETRKAMKKSERDKEEPYDAEVAKGLHPSHVLELDQLVQEKNRLRQQVEQFKQEKGRIKVKVQKSTITRGEPPNQVTVEEVLKDSETPEGLS